MIEDRFIEQVCNLHEKCFRTHHITGEEVKEILQNQEKAKKYDSVYQIIKSHQNCDCNLNIVMRTLLNNCEVKT